MKKLRTKKMRIIEAAGLVVLCACLCAGLWARREQRELSGELVRLHVIAQSDSDADQQLKLRVRDRVLMWLAPYIEDAADADEAREIISSQLENLERVAQYEIDAAGMDYDASAVIEGESYPTREYSSFALPAGDYVSLKITLGEGAGQNWWCVVFPPLCMAASTEDTEAFSQLSAETQELILAQDGEYILKFRIIELIENIERRIP